MLWAFDMAELPEEPIDLKEYDGLSGRSPIPFRVTFTPRDAKVAEVLRGVGSCSTSGYCKTQCIVIFYAWLRLVLFSQTAI